jgi:two-component system, chemotaxis family, protein-glutamate methylesterase/glutaminase
MKCRNVIVVGGSAGAVEPLRVLVGGLPRELAAAVCIVLHLGNRRSMLPELFRQVGPLPAGWAADGDRLQPGRIYVAPPDHHLLVVPGHVRLSRSPRENRTRPAVDPLFRSAAEVYGPAVIGVILSGMLGDGTAGFSVIKSHGGTTVVQDPKDAQYPSMPLTALASVPVDYRLPADAMADLLTRLVESRTPIAAKPVPWRHAQPNAARKGTEMEGNYQLGDPVALTCPECGGALKESRMDSLPYYTCHIGHRFAGPEMDAAQFQMMEQALEIALRALNERAALCQRMAVAAQGKGQALSAEHWEATSQEITARAEVLQRFLQQDWPHPSSTAEDQEDQEDQDDSRDGTPIAQPE